MLIKKRPLRNMNLDRRYAAKFNSQRDNPRSRPPHRHLAVTLATPADREDIYRLRHDIYARELAQHPTNGQGLLRDRLDDLNVYLIAHHRGQIAGFISITPPEAGAYSVEKYLDRRALPFPCDAGLYEVRLLTVLPAHRRRPIAAILMLAAFRWVDARGGTRLLAIGRREVLPLYRKAGMQSLGVEIRSGAVTFELMQAMMHDLRRGLRRFTRLTAKLDRSTHWRLDPPTGDQTTYDHPTHDHPSPDPAACFHGGRFFEAIGAGFDSLERRDTIINADVLDAWFDPAPGVLDALRSHLPWLARTSPPTHAEGLVRAIAQTRGVSPSSILAGAGSSALIYLALREWLRPTSRALILDPTYGEYAHVLERVVGCRVERLPLTRAAGYAVDLAQLRAAIATAPDLVVLVNPNSPTGRHIPREALAELLLHTPSRTRIWVDETYSEYAGPAQSVDRLAAQSANIVVCKSMSKVYALSGLRAAYLCGPEPLITPLRHLSPPWAVSLLAQVAAVKALADPDYYAQRYRQTHELRATLIQALATLDADTAGHPASDMGSNTNASPGGNQGDTPAGATDKIPRNTPGGIPPRIPTALEILPATANFVLCHLPPTAPTAAQIVQHCQSRGIFLRNAAEMGLSLGDRAIRIAVKSAPDNARIVQALAEALRAS